jgi:hypothetical protein
MPRINQRLLLIAISAAAIGGWQLWSSAPQSATAQTKAAAASSRLDFEVVESYDAKYLGDTPGHMGRAGGLENTQVRVALGDGVYRGDELVGRVTRLNWNRAHGALDIEFDPVDHARVCVGDKVAIALDAGSAERAQSQRGK